jgi:alkanesulfonate monooxygenase SsuD/methylene tetrahydromethanopterin reductase-like flavin-dependent oxidoreductase (luciferase family)
LRLTAGLPRDGYETIWVADHLHNAIGTQDLLFECWTTTAALLRDTRRIRVGQLVTCNGYRNPALQAKMASTLDVISGGRLTFGIGAGWWEPDYRAYGYEYPGTAERLRRLEEAAQVILAMWTEDTVTFDGRYYQVKDAINQPKGVQRPHIPLMIAGGGEKVTLKLTRAGRARARPPAPGRRGRRARGAPDSTGRAGPRSGRARAGQFAGPERGIGRRLPARTPPRATD